MCGWNSGVLGIACVNEEKLKRFYKRGERFICLFYLLKLFRSRNEKLHYYLSNTNIDLIIQIDSFVIVFSFPISICSWFFVTTTTITYKSLTNCQGGQIEVLFRLTSHAYIAFVFQAVTIKRPQLKTAARAFVYKMTNVNKRVELEPLTRVYKTKTKLRNFWVRNLNKNLDHFCFLSMSKLF